MMFDDPLDPLKETYRRGRIQKAEVMAEFMAATTVALTSAFGMIDMLKTRIANLEKAQDRKYYPDVITEERCGEHNILLHSCLFCAPRESD